MSESPPNYWNVMARSLLSVDEADRSARLAEMDERQRQALEMEMRCILASESEARARVGGTIH